MPLYVCVHLPDGREAIAEREEPIQPIIKVMRRIHADTMAFRDPDPADYALVAEWLDQQENPLTQERLVQMSFDRITRQWIDLQYGRAMESLT
jgi:hypothetical protein